MHDPVSCDIPPESPRRLRGSVAITQAFLTLSEVIGHVDLLVNERRVRKADDGGILCYEAIK